MAHDLTGLSLDPASFVRPITRSHCNTERRRWVSWHAHLERGVISIEVDAAVTRVVESLVEALEVLERQAGDSRRVSSGVDAVSVVGENSLKTNRECMVNNAAMNN